MILARQIPKVSGHPRENSRFAETIGRDLVPSQLPPAGRSHLRPFLCGNSPDIWIWVMKILLGIVYAERILPLRRSKPAGRRILPREMKDSLRMTHFFVQQLNLKINFEAEGKLRVPGSIFIFNLKKYRDLKSHFHFRDDMGTLSVFLRLGNRGIIAVSDGGALELELGPLVKRDAAVKLHPVQFDEMGARLFYKSSLFNRTPFYITMHNGNDYHVIQTPLGGLSPKPIFDEWDHPTYAHYLAAFMGTEVDRVMPLGGSLVRTWLGASVTRHLEPLALEWRVCRLTRALHEQSLIGVD
jgi:hypothetical protein